VFESVTRAARPGVIRRLAAGAWHAPAGIGFLLGRPRLWPWAALPALLIAVGMLAGLVAAWVIAPQVQEAVLPRDWPPWLLIPGWFTVLAWTLFSGIVIGLALALLLASPLLELLQRRVEVLELGSSPDASRGILRDALESLRGALYFALAAPFVFAIGLIPLVGPPLAALWAATALAFQQTDSPLGRRGRDFQARRRWHSTWRPESLGFGLAGLVTLVTPVVNLIAVPSLAIGAARLVIELDTLESQEAPGVTDDGGGPDAEPPAAEPRAPEEAETAASEAAES
jgi:uncharacterized protein involved in cysteine biosynthesis